MGERVASCVWRTTAELVLAADERFGEPVDSYVNGSQVWLRDDGPGGIALEWRLHPVAGFQRPSGVGTADVFAAIVFALRNALELPLPVDQLWDGLEAFPCYGDEVEPVPLAASCTAALGIAPEAFGIVDHTAIADSWERTQGTVSIVDALFVQLTP